MTEITAKRIKGLTWLANKSFLIYYGIIIENQSKLSYMPLPLFPSWVEERGRKRNFFGGVGGGRKPPLYRHSITD